VTRLEDVAFRLGSWAVNWITSALRTVTPEHEGLQRISIRVPFHLTPSTVCADARQTVGEGIFRQWSELDRLLVQLWESHSIRPKVIYMTLRDETEGTRDFVQRLLPATTTIGMTDLVECHGLRR